MHIKQILLSIILRARYALVERDVPLGRLNHEI